MAAPSLKALSEGLAAGALIFSVIERKTSIDYSKYDANIKIRELEGAIELKNVKFAYPSRPEQLVLKGVSLHFNPGETTAIVGATGSGKSTIIQLI